MDTKTTTIEQRVAALEKSIKSLEATVKKLNTNSANYGKRFHTLEVIQKDLQTRVDKLDHGGIMQVNY